MAQSITTIIILLAKSQDAEAYDPLALHAEERELTQLIKKINTTALETRASHLRKGIRCSISPLRYDRTTRASVMGGMNYHVEIRFEDGVVWLARIRRFNATSPPPALRDYIIRSEVATLMLLEETKVPAPRVYDYALEQPGNLVGVGYILMEKLPGNSLDSSLTAQQKRKVMDQLSDIFIELRKYPFRTLGSLDSPGTSQVGPLTQESRSNFVLSEMRTMGPFHSTKDCLVSSLKFLLDMIIQEEMYTEQAVDAYLIHRFLLDLVPLVAPPFNLEGEFYLKHADDKGDHILIDKDCNITGIVDWEWAHTTPACQAFNSPLGLLNVAEFFDGKNCISEDETIFAHLFEEKGHKDLAQVVRNGRMQHQFAFCCGFDLSSDWDGFLGLFRGLREAVGVDDGLGWDDWKAAALDRYKDERGLQVLVSRCSNQ